jgi:hypothetical protein
MMRTIHHFGTGSAVSIAGRFDGRVLVVCGVGHWVSMNDEARSLGQARDPSDPSAATLVLLARAVAELVTAGESIAPASGTPDLIGFHAALGRATAVLHELAQLADELW